MSARPATRPVVTRAERRSAVVRRRRRRRRALTLLGFAALMALLAAVVVPRLPDAVRELALPLRHEDIIRQQSTAKGVDPSLVAAVIYAESKFRDQTSHAGARGLMQITPATAKYIARLSGGTAFEQGDLATPQVNISYGVYYLRYLMRRYGDNTVLALAAYNGGAGQRRPLGRRGGDGRAGVRRRADPVSRDARVRRARARGPRRLPAQVQPRARPVMSS